MPVLKFTPKPELQANCNLMPKMPQDYKDADFAAMFAIWGNGNAHKGFIRFYEFTMRLALERTKYPTFAKDAHEALEATDVEFHKLEYAIYHESERKQFDAALGLAAAAFRFAGGEHLKLTE